MNRLIAAVALGFCLPATAALAADPRHGQQVFEASCSSCHSTEPGQNMVGPSLSHLFGRKAGAEPGFRSSKALQGSGVVWDAARLDAYLAAPQKVIPGVRMPFPGLASPADRADLIAYLRTLR
jgi:cytochrome c2